MPTSALALVKEFYERIWNQGDLTAIEGLLAPAFAFRGSLGSEMRGRREFGEYGPGRVRQRGAE